MRKNFIKRSSLRKNYIRFTAEVLSAIAVSGLLVGAVNTPNVMAATEHFNDASSESSKWDKWKTNWDSYSSNYENVSLTPGVNEKELNFAWYSQNEETPKVRIGTDKDKMESATEFAGKQTKIDSVTTEKIGSQYYSNKVTVTDLKENTSYYYQVFQNGKWQDVKDYDTKSFSSFSFLYVGDPQIGASKNQVDSENTTLTEKSENYAARNDGYNWNEVLKNAVKNNPDVSFMVSAGDQVNTATSEEEYAAYLGATTLSSLPVATTIGNHDSTSLQYSYHYNNPNTLENSGEEYTKGKTQAGTDYYYRYGNMLCIVLDTNNYNCATHENVIKKAISENEDATWKVVMFHQDIYGSGLDHSDSDGMILRTQLTPIMDKYDIDVVLQGHDHTYSRTYQLTGDGNAHTSYDTSNYRADQDYLTQNNCYSIVSDTVEGTVVNPEGTVYLEANSATGSKFYNLIATQQDYVAERSQTWTPTYSVIDVTDNTFSVKVYDSTTNKQVAGSSSYTIVKNEKASIKAASSYEKTIGSDAFKIKASTNSDGKITYESTDESVASVSSKGLVSINGEGKATIKVSVAGTTKYDGATKNIKITVKPEKQSVKVVKSSSKLINVSWKKDSKATGYELVYSTDKKFKKGVVTKKISSTKTTSYNIKGIKKGKTYYIKARTYKKAADKSIVYGTYSNVIKKTVK